MSINLQFLQIHSFVDSLHWRGVVISEDLKKLREKCASVYISFKAQECKQMFLKAFQNAGHPTIQHHDSQVM
jgi:glucose-6-phosphate 1-dehydrogenase